MRPEQYGWKINVKATFLGAAVPIELERIIAVIDEEEAIRAGMKAIKDQWPAAREIVFCSADKIWRPDFRLRKRTKEWEMRSRDETRTNVGGEPWLHIPGKPAMKLRRIDSWGGWTYYISAGDPEEIPDGHSMAQ